MKSEQIDWHSEPATNCLRHLHTSMEGLTDTDAKARLNKIGLNELPAKGKKATWRKWANQFHNILIYILLAAAVVVAVLQQWVDAGVILSVVLLNALIGYVQEAKAEKLIEALKEMMTLQAIVIRKGKRQKVLAKDLVPGDIVLLRMGDKVPADLRLLKTNSLQIDEAILTGESVPIEKSPEPILLNTPLVNRTSMAYSGTFVTYGMGIGVVAMTGQKTEIGKISSMLSGLPELTTPLLKQVSVFGRWIGGSIVAIALIIFLFGVFIRAYPLEETFMAAVAAAVAFIPEGLPAIITIALALAVTRMARQNAIVRRLASVETLSSVSVICTDKTGTLTKNELTIQKIIMSHQSYQVTGSGYNDVGLLSKEEKPFDAETDPALSTLIRSGILCNEAELKKTNENWRLIGNPVDGALLALGLKANLTQESELTAYPKTDFIPFDSTHKLMASLHHDHEGNSFIFIKGAPEKILALANDQLEQKEKKPLDKAMWEQTINTLAKQGLRVIALAYQRMNTTQTTISFKDLKRGLTFLGVVGLIDPPRTHAKDAVTKCQQAGICVKMVTGDHSLTAQAIAKSVGIQGKKVLTGDNLDAISDQEISRLINKVNIFARVTPSHKLRLVNILRKEQHIIAMTGDGVNDAPALKNADIGISMGIKGTEVAKEASEIVLADDNFSSIEKAVEQARNVYNNIKKAILFVLPTNGGEGLSIILAILLGYLLPITPLQILWVNMITAVTLGLALAFEPHEQALMQLKPRNPKEPLLSIFLLWRILFVSLVFVACLFGLFLYELSIGTNVQLARTMVVDLLVLLEVVYLLNCRRIYSSAFSKESFSNCKPALIAIGIVILFQLGFTYLPFMQFIFHSTAIHLVDWGLIIVIALIVFFIIELEKAIFRKYRTQ